MIGEVWWGWTGDGDSACEHVHLSSTYSTYTCMYNCVLAIYEWKEQGLDLQLRNYTLYKLACQIPLAEIVIITIKNTLNECKCLSKSSCCLDSTKNKQTNFYFSHRTSLGQGYVFTGVCDSVHSGGSTWPGTPPRDQVHPTPRDQVHPPRPGAPPRNQVHPPRPGTPPGTRYTPETRYTPLGPGTPPPQRTRSPLPPQSMLGDTVNARARILLECNLVLKRQRLLAPALSQSFMGTNRVT